MKQKQSEALDDKVSTGKKTLRGLAAFTVGVALGAGIRLISGNPSYSTHNLLYAMMVGAGVSFLQTRKKSVFLQYFINTAACEAGCYMGFATTDYTLNYL